jgi:hypothetical protein
MPPDQALHRRLDLVQIQVLHIVNRASQPDGGRPAACRDATPFIPSRSSFHKHPSLAFPPRSYVFAELTSSDVLKRVALLMSSYS